MAIIREIHRQCLNPLGLLGARKIYKYSFGGTWAHPGVENLGLGDVYVRVAIVREIHRPFFHGDVYVRVAMIREIHRQILNPLGLLGPRKIYKYSFGGTWTHPGVENLGNWI